jgi:hypothetical protein
MKKLTRTQQTEIDCQNEVAHNATYIAFIHAHRATLERLDIKFTFFSTYIDFDNLERPALLAVMKAFPGRWLKDKNLSGGINYTLETPLDGLTVRVYNGEPPPSCVIEERVEWVVVPERMEKRVTRTIKCPEATAASS